MDHLLWIVPLLIITFMILTVVRRGYQMRDLVAHGLPVTGKVLRKMGFDNGKGPRKRFLRYEFSIAGHSYSHKIAVTADAYDRYAEGDAIELIYLPDNPKISAHVEMVEQCRQALSTYR